MTQIAAFEMKAGLRTTWWYRSRVLCRLWRSERRHMWPKTTSVRVRGGKRRARDLAARMSAPKNGGRKWFATPYRYAGYTAGQIVDLVLGIWIRECKMSTGVRFMEANAADEMMRRKNSNGEKIGTRSACCTSAWGSRSTSGATRSSSGGHALGSVHWRKDVDLARTSRARDATSRLD